MDTSPTPLAGLEAEITALESGEGSISSALTAFSTQFNAYAADVSVLASKITAGNVDPAEIAADSNRLKAITESQQAAMTQLAALAAKMASDDSAITTPPTPTPAPAPVTPAPAPTPDPAPAPAPSTVVPTPTPTATVTPVPDPAAPAPAPVTPPVTGA